MTNVSIYALMYFSVLMFVPNAVPGRPKSAAGRLFVIFPYPSFQPPSGTSLFTAISVEAPSARVKVWTEGGGPQGQPIHREYLIKQGKTTWGPLDRGLKLSGTGKHQSALVLRADQDIVVTVYRSVSPTELAAVMVLPVHWAGPLYLFPVQNLLFSAVVGTKNDTEIKITFTTGQAKETVQLERFEIYFFEKDTAQPRSLEATEPVLVMVGYYRSASAGSAASAGQSQAYSTDYLLPSDQWSRKYICVGIPGTITAIAASPHVNVTVVQCAQKGSNPQEEILDFPSFSKQFTVTLDCPVQITATAPIQVVQFISQQGTQNEFLFNVVAEDKFLHTYTFSPAAGNQTVTTYSLFVVIKDLQISGLHFQGVTITNYASKSTVSDYGVYTYTPGHSDRVTVYHDQGVGFGLYILGTTSSNQQYWTKLDMGLTKPVCIKDFPEPFDGDNIDNDCDNRTDEETSDTTDLDGDGMTGEDKALFGAVHGSWGQWEEWYCSAKCDRTEVRRRIRFCDSPEPTGRGRWCTGDSIELGGYCVTTEHLCLLICPHGMWGKHCSRVCPDNCMSGTCQVQDGRCGQRNCSEGFRGDFCDVPCARETYGLDCLRNCSRRCLTIDCDPVTGQCDLEPVNTKFHLMMMVPIYICVPTIVVMILSKLCKSKTSLELLQILQWRTAVLMNQQSKLLSVGHGGTSLATTSDERVEQDLKDFDDANTLRSSRSRGGVASEKSPARVREIQQTVFKQGFQENPARSLNGRQLQVQEPERETSSVKAVDVFIKQSNKDSKRGSNSSTIVSFFRKV